MHIKKILSVGACSALAGLLLVSVGSSVFNKPEAENVKKITADDPILEMPIQFKATKNDLPVSFSLPTPPTLQSNTVLHEIEVTGVKPKLIEKKKVELVKLRKQKPVAKAIITPVFKKNDEQVIKKEAQRRSIVVGNSKTANESLSKKNISSKRKNAISKNSKVLDRNDPIKAAARDYSTVEDEIKREPLISNTVERRLDIAQKNNQLPVQRGDTEFVIPGPEVESEGRVLLRVLEHGSGPEVEIAWPNLEKKQRALYQRLHNCYGMEVAVIDNDGTIFRLDGKSVIAWKPNLDRFSAFFRQPSGRVTLEEQLVVKRIQGSSTSLYNTRHIRLFPRRVDALLLGGLKYLIGKQYNSISDINAFYTLENDSVLIEGITIDGRPIAGRIDLSASKHDCRIRT